MDAEPGGQAGAVSLALEENTGKRRATTPFSQRLKWCVWLPGGNLHETQVCPAKALDDLCNLQGWGVHRVLLSIKIEVAKS